MRSPVVTVEQLDLAFFGDHPDVPPYVADPRDDNPDLVPGILEHIGWVMSTTSWPEIDEEKAEMKALRRNRPDLTSMSDDELVARARSLQPWLIKLFDTHTVSSSSSGIAPGILFAIGQAIGDPTVPMKLISGIGDVDSAEPSYALWELSRMIRVQRRADRSVRRRCRRVARPLARVGHRRRQGVPRRLRRVHDRVRLARAQRMGDQRRLVGDQPATAADHARPHPPAETTMNRRASATRPKPPSDCSVIEEVRAKVQPLGEELAAQFEGALVAGNMQAFRERTKSTIVIPVNELRVIFNELGRRHHDAGHIDRPDYIFMLLDEELEQFVASPTGWNDKLAGALRRCGASCSTSNRRTSSATPVVPPISTWAEARQGRRRHRSWSATCCTASPVAPAWSPAGPASSSIQPTHAISDPATSSIAPQTDPGWTPLFMAADGVVVNVGGQISHAIIVSRELGLPCVVSVNDATSRIPDGATIEVDGNNGTVTILEVPAP